MSLSMSVYLFGPRLVAFSKIVNWSFQTFEDAMCQRLAAVKKSMAANVNHGPEVSGNVYFHY